MSAEFSARGSEVYLPADSIVKAPADARAGARETVAVD